MNVSLLTDERRVRQLLALNQAALAITGALDLESLLQQIVDSARELVGCRYAALGILGDDGFIARFPTSGLSATEQEQIGALPRGHGLLGVMLRAGYSIRIPDMRQDSRRAGFPPHHPPMTSLLGVPVFVRGQLVGDLYLTDKIDAAEFRPEDEWLVELLATHVAAALVNAALYEEAQHGRDVAEREQARLHELEQMKDEFLATAAHELRTPLTTIRMAAGLARAQVEQLTAVGPPALPPRLLDLLRLLEDGSGRMQVLVNDLLDLTRLEQDRVPLALVDLDLREVVAAAAETTRPLLARNGQTLGVHLPEGYYWVRGDRQRLEQVFVNLLFNAHKYAPAGQPVEVRATRAGGEGRITVRDHGPGVPAAERERIFEPFYRSSLHRDDSTAGTGLGLPIARTIAHKHGGRLWYEPAADGGGCFILALPLLPSPA